MGIFYRASSGAIENTHVTNIFQPGAPGCQAVFGIFAQSDPGVSNVVIDSNTVDNYGKNGITANEVGTAVTVIDNTVTGRGPVGLGDAAQNGVQIGWGATALLRDNSVSGNYYTPPTWVACGMLYFEAGGVRSSRNRLFANEKSTCNEGKGGGYYNPSP